MTTITRFEDIRAWQTARELTRYVYALSGEGSFARDFGLREQMRRSAVSIMSNIAEGFESEGQAQFIRFLGYAKASAAELRSQAYVALDAGHITQTQFDQLYDHADKAGRQIARFMAYLQAHPDQRRLRDGRISYEVESIRDE